MKVIVIESTGYDTTSGKIETASLSGIIRADQLTVFIPCEANNTDDKYKVYCYANFIMPPILIT